MKIFDDVRKALGNGWCKGMRSNAAGEVCLLGAFNQSRRFSFSTRDDAEKKYSKEIAALAECITEHDVFSVRLETDDTYNPWAVTPKNADDAGKVCGFNNHADTNLDDVFAMVDCAERKCETYANAGAE